MGLGPTKLSFTAFLPEHIPVTKHPRWAVLGRSNVGKSSFLNALVHPTKIFKTGNRPGVTIGVIGAIVQLGRSKESCFELIDLPGFGYSERTSKDHARWEQLVEELKEKSEGYPLQWIWLIDPVRDPEALEDDLLMWLANAPFALIFTKADKFNAAEKVRAEKAWQRIIDFSIHKPLWVSSLRGDGIQEFAKSARSFVKSASFSGGDSNE